MPNAISQHCLLAKKRYQLPISQASPSILATYEPWGRTQLALPEGRQGQLRALATAKIPPSLFQAML